MNKNKITVTVLGSGSAVPYDKRVSASYLVEFKNIKILLDAGFCVVYRLADIGISLDEIDAIFMTHKHPDHFMGLIHFLFALRHPIYKNDKLLKIYGFGGLKEYLSEFEKILGKWIKPDREINIVEDCKGNLKGFNYEIFPVLHTDESIGILLENSGKKILYTGDTEYSDNLFSEISEIDLLIADCAAEKDIKVKGHMNYEDVLRLGKKLKTKNLLFSHFYPNTDKFYVNASDYDFSLFKARDLMKIFL